MPGSHSDDLYFTTGLPGNFHQINRQIQAQYDAARSQAETQRSHYFSGRYENIYINRERIPALQPVLEAARAGAAGFLSQPGAELSVGFWFNEMQPGHVTLPHRHDEDDELVSAVYYVRVPAESGDLILTDNSTKRVITPREGMFVYFRPDVLHEVTENKSGAIRLSIGMNFGIRK